MTDQEKLLESILEAAFELPAEEREAARRTQCKSNLKQIGKPSSSTR